MLNQVTLIGRVVETPNLRKLEGDMKAATLVLAVCRPFKNIEGNYDTDFLRISLWNGVAESASSYLGKGDIVGIKGRVSCKETEVLFSKEEQLKKKINVIEIIGERICFIHSYKKKEDRNEMETLE